MNIYVLNSANISSYFLKEKPEETKEDQEKEEKEEKKEEKEKDPWWTPKLSRGKARCCPLQCVQGK